MQPRGEVVVVLESLQLSIASRCGRGTRLPPWTDSGFLTVTSLRLPGLPRWTRLSLAFTRWETNCLAVLQKYTAHSLKSSDEQSRNSIISHVTHTEYDLCAWICAARGRGFCSCRVCARTCCVRALSIKFYITIYWYVRVLVLIFLVVILLIFLFSLMLLHSDKLVLFS